MPSRSQSLPSSCFSSPAFRLIWSCIWTMTTTLPLTLPTALPHLNPPRHCLTTHSSSQLSHCGFFTCQPTSLAHPALHSTQLCLARRALCELTRHASVMASHSLALTHMSTVQFEDHSRQCSLTSPRLYSSSFSCLIVEFVCSCTGSARYIARHILATLVFYSRTASWASIQALDVISAAFLLAFAASLSTERNIPAQVLPPCGEAPCRFPS